MASLVQTPAPGARLLRHVGDGLEVSLKGADLADAKAFVRTNLSGEWHDYPMKASGRGSAVVHLDITRPGVFSLKACLLPHGATEPVWPDGGDAVVKVAPEWTRFGASIYTAFVRQFFPPGKPAQAPYGAAEALDAAGFAVVPPSGTFRELARRLDHIVYALGFRIVQLLPVFPVPTTYARMGRYGSPFASLDFYSVDPALAEFDRRTTPLEQFCELADAVHARGARLFLDLPANHTGWASAFQTHHPDWFRRNGDGSFKSPGAWGVTWEDLVELDFSRPGVAEAMADVFLFWCAKGVDGFRCDAGYMVPVEAWRHITQRVKAAFPETVFLLEGLGGRIETTDELLADGGIDWAYSEIFQQEGRGALAWYLPDANARSQTLGPLVHFAETHDNNRLAARGRCYASMRTALAALLSQQGTFGITAGVEWFCADKIDVHGAPPLNWGAADNQVALLSRLNAILRSSACFQAGASISFVTAGDKECLVAVRTFPEAPPVLVAVNLDCGRATHVAWESRLFPCRPAWDLVSARQVPVGTDGGNAFVELPPGGFMALTGDVRVLRRVEMTDNERRSGVPARLPQRAAPSDDTVAFHFPRDTRRIVMVPPGYSLAVDSKLPFRAILYRGGKDGPRDHAAVVAAATAAPCNEGGDARYVTVLAVPAVEVRTPFMIEVTGFEEGRAERTISEILALPPADKATWNGFVSGARIRAGEDISAVLANRRGAMAQVRAAFGEIASQYDAILALNPDRNVPADRQVFFTRCRAWVRRRGHSFALDASCLESFEVAGNRTAVWRFTTPAGFGESVGVEAVLTLAEGTNAARIDFSRTDSLAVPVELVLRPDVEARNFHGPTLAYQGAEQAYPAAVRPRADGFGFVPAGGTIPCEMRLPGGAFHNEPVWSYSVAYPVEAGRGLAPTGDLFSPGWFSATLSASGTASLVAGETGTLDDLGPEERIADDPMRHWPPENHLDLFIADRDGLKTVIAGFPWFLDWGRDTLIFLRGFLAASGPSGRRRRIAEDVLREFARFEDRGTLPNIIHGTTVGNRDTSDAPLWFIVVAGEAGFTEVRETVASIIRGYVAGTPNGIRVDPESGLVYSPSHFTWMDTNYPAATPREGYPVEIQALWIAALTAARETFGIDGYGALERQARKALVRLFSLPGIGLADSLRTGGGFAPAAKATPEDAIRPNQLLAVTLGAVAPGSETARAIVRATEELLVPGAIRSLADRPVTVPQLVRSGDRLLNDPLAPYWGRYEGDEDTRRKPAYHNGTAWGWLFPMWCEASVAAGRNREAAKAILASAFGRLETGSLGQLPEIVDGDAPHAQRGCLAQAWSLSELVRVWNLI